EEWRMVSNQVLVARLAVGLLTLGFALSGCSHFRSHQQASTESVAPATVSGGPASGAPAEPEVTATEAAANAAGTRTVVEPPPAPDTSLLKPGAPMHYTVKRGDTLWGIATMYLKDPWLWPEVWIINPQIPNPHLIYPGDTLALAFGADGRPQIRVEQAGAARLEPRLRSTALDNAIPTIPYSAIAAFLSRPTVMSSEQISHAPYVLACRDRPGARPHHRRGRRHRAGRPVPGRGHQPRQAPRARGRQRARRRSGGRRGARSVPRRPQHRLDDRHGLRPEGETAR